MDANKVLERFQANLDYQISQQTDTNSALFIISQVAKGNAGNEDLVELRGYYKGLKVAKEILERVIAEEEEMAAKEKKGCSNCKHKNTNRCTFCVVTLDRATGNRTTPSMWEQAEPPAESEDTE